MGTSTGYDNSPLGPTHHIIDDWGTLKGLHGVDIFCPSTMGFAKGIVSRLLKTKKPTYLRIPKGGLIEPDSGDDQILVGESTGEILLVCYGGTARPCLEVVQNRKGVSAVLCNKLNPLDGAYFKKVCSGFAKTLVVEDQFPFSGLYGSLCQVWVEQGIQSQLKAISKERDYILDVGTSPDYYLKRWGLDVEGILSQL